MPRRPRRRYPFRVRVLLQRGGLALAGLMLLGLFWWWLAHLGPRAVGTDALPPGVAAAGPGSDGAAVAADEAAQVDALRRALQQKLLEVDQAGENADLARTRLAEAIGLQRDLVKLARGIGLEEPQRLAELEQRLAMWRAGETNRQIEALDAEGTAAFQTGRAEAATTAWREALALQREVNRSAAPSTMKNFVREARMDQALQEIAAAPLAAEVQEALRVARAAVAAEDWAAALAAYGTARDRQQRINGEFARTRFADLLLSGQIEREIQSLDAAGAAEAVVAQEAVGDEAMTAGRYREAALAYEQARQMQAQVNREFARSRFQSTPKVEQLEVKRQTAESVPLMEALRADDRAIAFLLRKRESANAAQRIAAAEVTVRTLVGQLPKSERLDPELQGKLSYLVSQRERLEEIQAGVIERLQPLPGAAELRMLKTEFPQGLYQQIMKANPSRHVGRAFPVDSVNWFEAALCCERLGWLLGRRVRLPTADEYRVAMGDDGDLGESANLVEAATGQLPNQSAAMAAGPANAAGFFDLRGNVAEWLAEAPDAVGEEAAGADLARLGGGSYLDRETRASPAVEPAVVKSERARHIGFRVVVEWTDE